jgi:hypothetical protein
VIVAVAPPEGVTVVGLTKHVGGIGFDRFDVIVHARLTVPLKPVPATSVRLDDAVPPGSTANGVNAAMEMVKSWPAARGDRANNAAEKQKTIAPLCTLRNLILDVSEGNLNMNSFDST